MTPAWILDFLAGLMLAVAAVSAARLTVAPPRRGDLADIDVPHLAHSGAMLYMFLAQTALVSGRAMSGMGGSAARTLEYPTLAFVFTLILAGYSVWDIDQLSGLRYGLRALLLSPGTTVGCRVLMGVGPTRLPCRTQGSVVAW
jgi:hypothetical protein